MANKTYIPCLLLALTVAPAGYAQNNNPPVNTELYGQIFESLAEHLDIKCLMEDTYYHNKKVTPQYIFGRLARTYRYMDLFYEDIKKTLPMAEYLRLKPAIEQTERKLQYWTKEIIKTDTIQIIPDRKPGCDWFFRLSEPVLTPDFTMVFVYVNRSTCLSGSSNTYLLFKEDEIWQVIGKVFSTIGHSYNTNCGK